jgi:serpin B
MNQWINKNTNGMIKEMISDISDSAVMFLINALTFEAEWQEEYQEFQVNTGKFTGEDGKTRGVDFMESEENYYLENGLGTGVIKPYSGGKTAFVALLPKESMTVEDYLRDLTGAALYDMIKNRQNTPVITKIPKFEMEYALSMADILKQMGMTDAFDEDLADFTGLGVSEAGNIFVSDVIHKAYINVDEKGTEAGAATAVIMTDGASAVLDEPEPKYVILDRPFVYMILDLENQVPLFMGTYMMPEEN